MSASANMSVEDEAQAVTAPEAPLGPTANLKRVVKKVLRAPVVAAWPAVEDLAKRTSKHPGLDILWRTKWDDTLDAALNELPALEACPHDVYRELLHETVVPKQHALVTENGAPIALISLRRCKLRWEPVAYQCIPGVIAPAVSNEALGRALSALGIEVRVPGGIGDEIAELKPLYSWDYAWYQLDLTGDYEAHWRAKKRQYTVRRARKKTAEMQRRVDDLEDLRWIVEQWREQWKDDPGQEIVATEDRLRFWTALAKAGERATLRLHTLQLLENNQRVAGLVFTSSGDKVMLQCGGRDPVFDDSYSRAATILAAVDWAKDHGFHFLDLAGGDFKRLWAPVGGTRHGIVFHGDLIGRFAWATRDD